MWGGALRGGGGGARGGVNLCFSEFFGSIGEILILGAGMGAGL